MGLRNLPFPGGAAPFVAVNPATGASTTTKNTGNGTNGSITLSPLIEVGDQLLLIECQLNASQASPPAGWDQVVFPTFHEVTAFTKTAEAGDPGATITIPRSSLGGDWIAVCRVYRADTGVVIVAATLGGGNAGPNFLTPALDFTGSVATVCEIWTDNKGFSSAGACAMPSTLGDINSTGGQPGMGIWCGSGNITFADTSPAMTATAAVAQDGSSTLAVALSAA